MRLVCQAVIPDENERVAVREMFCKKFASAYFDDRDTQTLYAEYHGDMEEIRHAFMETFSKYTVHNIEFSSDL